MTIIQFDHFQMIRAIVLHAICLRTEADDISANRDNLLEKPSHQHI